MIVDTSALIAVLWKEPEGEAFTELLIRSPVRISTATLLETRMVATSRDGATGRRRLDALLRDIGAEFVPVDQEQSDVAADAYRDFGRGSGHRARLNFGDCFSYALAAVRNEPLLHKGDDFTHTDIRSALDE